MNNKKIYTLDEFGQLLSKSASDMAADKELQNDALDVLVRADYYRWIHQTTWLGEPVLNLPQDMFALQEIIYRTHPQYIIEIGVAWGGSVLFDATLLEIIGGEKVIGIDIFIPDDQVKRIMSHGKVSERIELIHGSSLAQETVEQINNIVGDCKDVMVILDSDHTHDHVLQELHLYSGLIGKGQYMICSDTIIEDMPIQKHRRRDWGPNNNPKTALRAFFKENDRFIVDKSLDNKLLFSCNPGGFLKCIKD